MPISEETREQLESILRREVVDPSFDEFTRKWEIFNRVYNDLLAAKLGKKGNDRKKVETIAETPPFPNFWQDQRLQQSTRQLVELECVGSDPLPHEGLLQPTKEIKSATLYLRDYFGIPINLTSCDHHYCRPEKKNICNPIIISGNELNQWQNKEFKALLMIVYQIRCNIIHGDKRFLPHYREYNQYRRDVNLGRISNDIMNEIIRLILNP